MSGGLPIGDSSADLVYSCESCEVVVGEGGGPEDSLGGEWWWWTCDVAEVVSLDATSSGIEE